MNLARYVGAMNVPMISILQKNIFIKYIHHVTVIMNNIFKYSKSHKSQMWDIMFPCGIIIIHREVRLL
jgi:hypothetical protein